MREYSVGEGAVGSSGAKDWTSSRKGDRNSSYYRRDKHIAQSRQGAGREDAALTSSESKPASCIAGNARCIASKARFAARAGSAECRIRRRYAIVNAISPHSASIPAHPGGVREGRKERSQR